MRIRYPLLVNNALNNYATIRILKKTFLRSRKLPLGSQLFHLRCMTYFEFQDAFFEIRSVLNDIRESVRFINNFEGRLMKFSEIVNSLGFHVKKFMLDYPTRWNSTYEMLVIAFKMRDSFLIFTDREPSYYR